MMLQAAVNGMGLAYVLDLDAESLVRSGALCQVLQDWLPPFAGFYLYYSSNRLMTRHLKLFAEFIRVRTAQV